MAKEVMDIIPFGELLLETEDLDPMYVSLWKSKLTREDLNKWIFSWMCYYDSGVSCWITEQKDFFKAVMHVAKSGKEFGRGSQRVHHRGPPAIQSCEYLQERFNTACEVMDWIGHGGKPKKPMRANEGFDRACSLKGFGPCMSWRIPDMQECLDLLPIRWVDRDIDMMYDSPAKGAILCCERYGLGTDDMLMKAHRYLMKHFRTFDAPPMYTRKINVQETETMFCKWKSHTVGMYDIGRDTIRVVKGLSKYPKSKIAKELLRTMPKGCL